MSVLNQALLESLFRHAPTSFQIYGADGHSLLVNDAFRELFGSEPPADYCIFDDEIARAQGLTDLIRRAFAGETIKLPPFWYDPRQLEHVQVAEGKRVAIELTLFPLRGEDGTVTHVAVAHKDVTAREHLALGEEELACTLESIGDAVIATDVAGKVTRMNSVAERLTGWKRDDARGLPLAEVFHIINQDTRAPVESPVTAVLREGVIVGLANHTALLARDGREHAIADSGAPIRDRDGALRGVVLVFRDVTGEYHETNRLRTALAAGKMVALDADLARGETTLSDNARDVLGLLPDEPLDGSAIGKHLHPDDRARVFALRDEILATGKSDDIEFRLIRPDNGQVVWLERRGRIIRNATNSGYLVTGVLVDITERKHLEDARRRNDEQLRLALREGNMILYASDFDTGEITLSENAADMLGMAVADLPKRSDEMMNLLHPDDLARLLAERARLHRGDHAGRDLEMRYLRRDNGEAVWVERRGHHVTQVDGHTVGFGILVDITVRRRADELRARSADLELTNRRIEDANRLKSEFLANMSHELRTPLNAIIGFAEVLHDGQVEPSSPTHKEFLGDILASGRHLAQLINDILDLAKVEAGKLEFRAEPIHLPEVIHEVVSVLRSSAAARRTRIEVELDPQVDEIALDPARLKQVLYNYLSNAIKFTSDGGRVIVRTRPEPHERFRLEVEDTGAGIPPAQLGLLFVEFQQLDGGVAKRHPGTGLGLALTRRLVEAQGGTVGVQSTPGVGSVFYAVLPRRAGTVEPRRPRRTFGVPFARGKILVVEDDPRDQGVLIDVLTTAGYAVEVVSTGRDALSRAQEENFDAITLDLLLPDMNGLELLSGLRATGRHADVPIVVVTVVGDARAVAGFAIHDVLDKPLDGGKILRSLERAGVRPTSQAAVLVVDDDPAALRLMQATLEPLGYRVVCKADGQAGLDAAALRPPAAIVLDLMMPGMDGFEFLERLREDPRHADTPVVIWSLKQLTRNEELRLAASASAVVTKQGGPPAVARMLAALAPARRPS